MSPVLIPSRILFILELRISIQAHLCTSRDARQNVVFYLGRQRPKARRINWKSIVIPDKMCQQVSINILSHNQLAHLISGERGQPLNDVPERKNHRT
jgi:hypothetical protein